MLDISKLTAGYNGKPIVEIPHFSLESGEHALILGASGSGKTTLLYALAGLLTPLSGSIRLNAMELTAMRPAARDRFRGKHLGIIYQTLHMVSALTVRDNLLLVQYAAGIPRTPKKVNDLLAQLDLAELADRKPDQLSQGQQQRVAIARAAINSPKLILGDEPTSALDDTSCDNVMKLLLATAKKSGASLIVATHDARIQNYFDKTITLGAVA